MRNTPKLAALVAMGLVATWADAGPPPPGWRPGAPPGFYRPPAVVAPVYPGWRPGYWGGVRPGYWGGYWGPRVVITPPAVIAPWPYAPAGVYAVPYAAPPLVLAAPPAPSPAAPDTSYWYYCTQPAGYFPYVQDCSQPWMKVVPQLPGDNTAPPRLAQ